MNQAQVQNRGSRNSGTFEVKWYLSRDHYGSSDDILLSDPLGFTTFIFVHGIPGRTRSSDFSFTLQLSKSIPTGWRGDSYFIVMKTDASNDVKETKENNNFGQMGLTLDYDTIKIVTKYWVDGEVSYDGDARPVALTNVDHQQTIRNDQTTWIVIHGRDSSPDSEDISQLWRAIDNRVNRVNSQVLVLDWRAAASSFVGEGENYIQPVATWAAAFLKEELGLLGTQLNLVGHSWGAYVAAEIAELFGEVNSIVALDPARHSRRL